jgi:hypothetical protein
MSMTGLKWDIPTEVGNNLEHVENGEIPQSKNNLAPMEKLRKICDVNADKGADMRSHGNFMHKGQ